MTRKIMTRGRALTMGFLDGLASSGALVVNSLANTPDAAMKRALYRGEGIREDIKMIGRDMRRSTQIVIAKR